MSDQTQLQNLRLESIAFQLQSLESQARVIQLLFTEHHDGVDLGQSPESENVLRVARKLNVTTNQIVESANQDDKEAVAEKLEKIRHKAKYLGQHAASFRKHSVDDAEDHLKEMDESDSAAQVAHDRAAVSCYLAETGQYRSYEGQLVSFANLCLEVAYFAAESVELELQAEKLHLLKLSF